MDEGENAEAELDLLTNLWGCRHSCWAEDLGAQTVEITFFGNCST
jgi:hypothetical protein